MQDTVENLVALGARADAAHGWVNWHQANPNNFVQEALNKARKLSSETQSVPATEYGAEGQKPDRSLDVQVNCASEDAIRENTPREPEQGWQRNHDRGLPAPSRSTNAQKLPLIAGRMAQQGGKTRGMDGGGYTPAMMASRL